MKDRDTIKASQDELLSKREDDFEDPILQAKEETLCFLLGEMDSPAEAISEPPTTDEEIDSLIEAVREEYEGLPKYSMFGDPNWKVRDVTIEMLEWAKGD